MKQPSNTIPTGSAAAGPDGSAAVGRRVAGEGGRQSAVSFADGPTDRVGPSREEAPAVGQDRESGVTRIAAAPPGPRRDAGAAIAELTTRFGTARSATDGPVPDGPAPEGGRRGGGQPRWTRRYIQRLTAIDLGSALIASSVASWFFFPGAGTGRRIAVASLFTVGWMLVLLMNRTYEQRHLGLGSEEFRRVLNAGVLVIALIAVADYGLKLDLARRYIVVAVPIALLLDVTGRFVLRKDLHRRRYRGEGMSRVVAVGPMGAVAHMTSQLRTEAMHGLEVVGACIVETQRDQHRSDSDASAWDDQWYDELEVPVLGGIEDVGGAVDLLDADVVAVMGTGDLPAGALRRLAWSLERTGTELLVAPGLVEVAGPRLTIRPYSNLPLLHVDQPRLSGLGRVLKSGLDRCLAVLGLIVLSPLLLVIAVLIRITSAGPVFFRQTRIGLDGQPFRLVKFRSMVSGADRQVDLLREQNENDGVLFKIKRDPRITAVGAKLRRFSLDELPQLFNVLTGSMSLVGPRPPLPNEVESYHSDVRRRLLVKPGITGLWQVSGRSDLSWDDSVRLDLRYVENWSMSLDVFIMWRTVRAVFGGRGAY